jgi:hypothetical protein
VPNKMANSRLCVCAPGPPNTSPNSRSMNKRPATAPMNYGEMLAYMERVRAERK